LITRLQTRIKRLVGITVCAAAMCVFVVGSAQAEGSGVQIVGPRLVPAEDVRHVIGAFPKDPREMVSWARGALKRVAALYKDRGFEFARVWYRVTGDKRSIEFEVDEGKMHQIVFVGANMVSRMMLKVDFDLPRNVFNTKSVTDSLRDLQEKYGIYKVTYRVREHYRKLVRTRFDMLTPQRELVVFLTGKESFGWNVGLAVDAQTGLTPKYSFKVPNLLKKGDRTYGGVALGIPYREFVFQEQPELQWVYGKLFSGYRFAPMAGNVLAPNVQASFESYTISGAVDVEQYTTLETELLGGASFILSEGISLTPWLGMDYDAIADIDMKDSSVAPPNRTARFRGLVRLELRVERSGSVLRRDLRNRLTLRSTAGFTKDKELTFETGGHGQLVYSYGYHDFIMRGRMVYLTGDLRFWDDVPLAGSYLRIFFDNKYQVRTAGQLQLGARFGVKQDDIKIGAFVDGSSFFDRRGETDELTYLLGGGPSVHFLLLDLLALDFYYGYGFDRDGTSHNLTFWVGSVF